jgi:hypothetical protein
MVDDARERAELAYVPTCSIEQTVRSVDTDL